MLMLSKVKVSLSNELKKKYGTSSFPVTKGDIVRIKSGSRKGEGGKIDSVDHRHGTVIIDGITLNTADNKQKGMPIDHSNVVITRLDLSNPDRLEKLREKASRKNLVVEAEPEPEEAAPEEKIAESEATQTPGAEEKTVEEQEEPLEEEKNDQ
jgi:large subunit ribosomal protein L24